MASASRPPRSDRCSTCSPASITTSIWRARADGWHPTPSGTSNRLGRSRRFSPITLVRWRLPGSSPSGDRRERVIQHVYEKYGQLGAAMTANVITYRGRSAAREVGKVLGFDSVQVDRLAKVMNHFEFTDPVDTLPRHFASVGLDLQT